MAQLFKRWAVVPLMGCLKPSGMKKTASSLRSLLLATLLWATTSGCNNGDQAAESGSTTDTAAGTTADTAGAQGGAVATLSGVYADTAVSGTARFTPGANGQVKLHVEVIVPAKANKEVAVHLHETGSCADSAKAAGPHWNPTGEQHGKWGTSAFHSGDIGNVLLDGAGRGVVELETDRWSIGGDARKDILNKAVIVHSGVDDYTSQPAGNAGNRIGCGVIRPGSTP